MMVHWVGLNKSYDLGRLSYMSINQTDIRTPNGPLATFLAPYGAVSFISQAWTYPIND